MKKIICIILCGLAASTLFGCATASKIVRDQTIGLAEDISSGIVYNVMDSIISYEDYEDYEEDSRQNRHEIRVFDAKDNRALRTITDYEVIFRYIKNITGIMVQEAMSFTSLSSIPPPPGMLRHYIPVNCGRPICKTLRKETEISYWRSLPHFIKIRTDIICPSNLQRRLPET